MKELVQEWLDVFTFQYVSINTEQEDTCKDLHHEFTFQYVSINTLQYYKTSNSCRQFTFQYVSINTHSLQEAKKIDFGIYIPICFY